MAARGPSWLSWPWLLRTLVSHVRLTARLLRDPAVPLLVKVALEAFLKWCPAGAVDFHRAAMAQGRPYCPMPLAGDVIDAEFRREDDGP